MAKKRAHINSLVTRVEDDMEDRLRIRLEGKYSMRIECNDITMIC